MANQIPVEIRKIRDPDGTTRIGAVAFLEEVLSTPDIKNRLFTLEKEYQSLIDQCNDILAETRSPKGRPDARLRWKLANRIDIFLKNSAQKIGVVLMNYTESIHRDLEVSESELRYILRFYKKYQSFLDLDDRINWSKYRELMDFTNENARKQCEGLIKAGKITSDSEIRDFKRRTKTGPRN